MGIYSKEWSQRWERFIWLKKRSLTSKILHFLSKTNLKTEKLQKPSKIKGLIDAYLDDRRSHVTEKRRVKREILGYFCWFCDSLGTHVLSDWNALKPMNTGVQRVVLEFKKWRQKVRRLKTGGEEGIRTLVTIAREHAFQAGALSHSATSPQILEILH